VLIAKGKSTIKELENKLRKNLSNLINIGKLLFFFFLPNGMGILKNSEATMNAKGIYIIYHNF
jgi:hypothetical protein